MTRQELENKYRAGTQEQFSSFMNAIKKTRADKEMTAFEIQSMMCCLIEEQIEQCRSYGERGAQMTTSERDLINRCTRLIACCMIYLAETKFRKLMRSHSLLLIEFASYTISTEYNLSELAIKCLSYSILDPGFSWTMIETCTCTDMLIYKMISKCIFDTKDKLPKISLNTAGSINIYDGCISLSSAPIWEPSVKSLSILDDKVEICTRKERDERLKATDSDNVQAIESFARTFMMTQGYSRKVKAPATLRSLNLGGKYVIRIEDCKGEQGEEYLICKALGTKYEDECEIKEEELVKGTYVSHLIPYFREDCIDGAVLVDEEEPPLFSIKDAYIRYAKKTAEEDCANKRVFEAMITDIFRYNGDSERDRLILISDKGYGGLMRIRDGYKVGDIITVTVVSVRGSGDNIFINLDEPDFYHFTKPSKFNPETVLNGFVSNEDSVVNTASMEKRTDADSVSLELVRQFGRIMSRDNSGSSIETYKKKLTASFISNIAGDEKNRIGSLSRATFLNQCLRVAEGIPVKERQTDVVLTEDEARMLSVLSHIDGKYDMKSVAALIQNTEGYEKENKIARLLMALAMSKSMPDEVKTKESEARKEICRILGVQDHFKGTTEKGGGKYGLGELANVEFKSSYIMRNDGKGADIDFQGRGQVFEAVCGMLNADGGCVYIGVNNFGDPLTAEDKGIKGDLKWFDNNFSTLKLSRSRLLGHPIPQPKDLDTYCLFLNDEKSLYFKPSVLKNIKPVPTEDFDAIRIEVTPSEFEIVKLYKDNTWEKGVAYVRDGEETVPMTRIEQERRLMKLRSVGKVEQFILTLTEAIDHQSKVILKDYASSNSNELKDRIVVPINLVYNNENLWAYDLEKKEPREFRLARIKEIEVLPERYTHSFSEGKADIFRWINPKVDYHVKLKLKVSALNALIENFSNAKNMPADELYQISPERWILDTHLHGWGAIVRFYVGNCGGSKKEIEILDTEDSDALKEEIRKHIAAVSC